MGRKKRNHADSASSSLSTPPKKLVLAKDPSPLQMLPPPFAESKGKVKRSPTPILVVPTFMRTRSKFARQSKETTYLEPFERDLVKYVKQKHLSNLNDQHMGELLNIIQKNAYQLSVASSIYKFKVANYDKKLEGENQNLKKELELEKKQSLKLHIDILELEEKVALYESKVVQLERELANERDKLVNAKKDLDKQRFAFEQHLEDEMCRLQGRIDILEKQGVDEYNSGLSFCYDCIMFVLKKEYPELDMTKLEAGVVAYMNEKDNKDEQQEGLSQIAEDAPPPVEGEPQRTSAQGTSVDPHAETS